MVAWLLGALWAPLVGRTWEGCIARVTVAERGLSERLLWACGASRDTIVFATDERIVVAPTDRADTSRRRLWTVSYGAVTGFTTITRPKRESSYPCIVLECDDARHELPVTTKKHHTRALLAILGERTGKPSEEPARAEMKGGA